MREYPRLLADELLVDDRHHGAEECAKTADGRITTLEHEVLKQKQDLGAIMKETAEMNQTMGCVRNDVQWLSRAVAPKREGSEDEHATCQKKIKVEEDEE